MKPALALTLSLLAAAPAFASELADLTLDTRQKAVPVVPRVVKLLTDTVQEHGRVGAVPICKEKAPALLAQQAGALGWEIRRVSLQTRNGERATPDVWEARNLAEFNIRAAQGEDVKAMEAAEIVSGADGKRYFRYMKALPVAPVCLGCHGDPASFDQDLRAVFHKEYPADQATGYSVGQIRGALTVIRPL